VQEELKLAPVSQEVYVKRQRPEPRVKEYYKPIPKVEVQAVVKSRPKVVEVDQAEHTANDEEAEIEESGDA